MIASSDTEIEDSLSSSTISSEEENAEIDDFDFTASKVKIDIWQVKFAILYFALTGTAN